MFSNHFCSLHLGIWSTDFIMETLSMDMKLLLEAPSPEKTASLFPLVTCDENPAVDSGADSWGAGGRQGLILILEEATSP